MISELSVRYEVQSSDAPTTTVMSLVCTSELTTSWLRGAYSDGAHRREVFRPPLIPYAEYDIQPIHVYTFEHPRSNFVGRAKIEQVMCEVTR